MSYDFSFRSLLNDYKKTKDELNEAEFTIRRLTGRYPGEFANGSSGQASGSSISVPRKRNLPYNSARKETYENTDEYEEEEEDDDGEDTPHKKPTLMSTVVAKRLGKSRKDVLEQNYSKETKARNRRLFSALLTSTLQKFENEEKKRMQKDAMRAEIERRVENATLEEKKKIQLEKELLFSTRREKKLHLRVLEKKLERVESHEVFELNHRKMEKFIRTRTEPGIFFIPATHTTATRRYLEESRSKIQELLKERKKCLEKDISEIEECYRKDSLPGDKENACPKDRDESESQDVPSESDSVVELEDAGIEGVTTNTTITTTTTTTTTTPTTTHTDQDFEPIYD